MAILFASNDITDFIGATSDTTAANRRTSFVSEAFHISGADNVDKKAYVSHPKAGGNVQWIHFVWKQSNTVGAGGFASSQTLCNMYDDAGDRLFFVDMTGASGARAQLNILGDTTVTDDITDFGTTLVIIDIKVDITTNLDVEIYVDEVLAANGAPANTGGKTLPVATVFTVTDDGGLNAYISEFIVADEDTRGMGLSKVSPNAAGNYAAWQGDHVETGDSDLGTGASSDATAQKLSSDLTTFGGPASSALRALLINNKCSVRGGTVGDLRNFLRISSTDYNGASMGPGATVANHITVYDTNPDTAADWDTTDIAGVEVGIESQA